MPPPRRLRLLGASGAIALGAALVLAGCGGDQNVLDPESEPAEKISRLFWIMMAGAWVGLGVVALFLFLGWARRHRSGFPGGRGDKAGAALVVVLGVAVPIVVLSVLFWYSDLWVLRATAAPAEGSTEMTVEVVGHQWFWEVRYPGTAAVTANEIHIPVRTRVNLVVRSADVIHSFWVPQLNRKIDVFPDNPNRILLSADRPGTYRGQCAEFCGLQHAHMGLLVIAEPRARFRSWLRNMAAPARPPRSDTERRGRSVFLSEACSACHTIRGTEAAGRVGPDLTHLQTRQTLAAVTIPNTTGYLGGWVLDPQHVKPGNKMPGLPLGGTPFQDLLAYLKSLR